jgi:hypothetical protein
MYTPLQWGVAGVAVALALQGLLSNMFSCLEVIASQLVRPRWA